MTAGPGGPRLGAQEIVILGLLGAVVCDRRLRRRGGAVRYQVIRKL